MEAGNLETCMISITATYLLHESAGDPNEFAHENGIAREMGPKGAYQR